MGQFDLPDLHDIFEVYANESRFGYSIIEVNLAATYPGVATLEIGAGIPYTHWIMKCTK